MRASGILLVAALLALSLSALDAQSTESVNAQNRFNIAGTIFNRTGINLLPLRLNLVGIPVSSEYSNPDILLTLNATSGGTGLNIYCNPGYGTFADPYGTYPGPGYAQWFSDLSTTVNQIFISKNDPNYKSPLANETSPPFFICSIMNNDANTTTNYTLVGNIIAANRTLDQSEQSVLSSLYTRCCSTPGACNAWKAQNSGSVDANGGSISTDFCSFPNQICSPTGNLYRLDLNVFNLSCVWPGDLLTQFKQLATLSLGGNTLLTGNTSAVFSTVANLTSLQFFDISGDTGIAGTLDSGATNEDLCAAVQGNLLSLSMNGIGLTGTLPSCLYSMGSAIISLDVGSNNFTGSIQNTIPSNSVLQLLHVQFNQLTGQLPSSLANAQYLVDLDTSVNNMSGTIPAAIGSIKTLKSFAIVRNNFSGAIPDSFGTSLNMEMFDVKENRLTALPVAWTNASYNAINTSYVNIRASFNQITGPFPAGLVNAQQLTFLILNENNMTGPLPSMSNMFVNLRALNVSNNQLSGTIPAAWNSTAIFSPTPVYISAGTVLQNVFDLSYNRFNGTLPSFLSSSSVPKWTRDGIYLQGNSLSANCANASFSYLASLCNSTRGPSAAVSAPPTTTAVAVPPTSTAPGIRTVPAPETSITQAGSPATVSTQSADNIEEGGGGGLSGGAIAGIIIGVLAAVALVAAVAFFVLRRRRGAPMMPTMNGGKFSMPTFGDGETGRKSSLTKGLTSLGSANSGFERFQDEKQNVELSPSAST